MSKFKFNHLQYELRSMADKLKSHADSHKFSHVEAKELILKTAKAMIAASVMMNRADYFLNGKEDAASFVTHFKSDLREVDALCARDSNAAKLHKALELLKNAECGKDAYLDVAQRGRWKLECEALLAEQLITA